MTDGITETNCIQGDVRFFKSAIFILLWQFFCLTSLIFFAIIQLTNCETQEVVDLGREVKAFGANWHKKEKLWGMKYEAIQALGLENSILDESSKFPNIGKSIVEIMNL